MAKETSIGLKKAQEFIRVIKAQGVKINSAYLLGSYAQGTPRVDSDIDIALISKDFSRNRASDWDKWI